ncbi:hypothetical protein [Streptomyces sp. STCH 565 A]|uniref:hypothetical protein n=1 Tax=Streptomyces sp. STCH 565 A TaxID=2950532 RepID=UPI002075F12B|nr:hypothetical protein [Streptomyces sp. STCH 565 A]MCM8555408.1 hypothetical protein [Streptomyces sp. STCH 565 A]
MTWPLAAAAGVVVWTVPLYLLIMTATGQSRGRRSLLEKLIWPWAMRRAGVRLYELQDMAESNSTASLCRDEVTWKFLQREDVLYQASARAFRVKATAQFGCTFAVGIVLFSATLSMVDSPWQVLVAMGAALVPVAITALAVRLVLEAGMGRWTTEVVTGTGRRAYALLLEDVPNLREAAAPQLPTPYQDPRTPAVKALQDFARALDHYALERALPDGRSPMPQLAAHFCAASVLVREAGEGVALDRVDSWQRAVGEVERLLSTRLRTVARSCCSAGRHRGAAAGAPKAACLEAAGAAPAGLHRLPGRHRVCGGVLGARCGDRFGSRDGCSDCVGPNGVGFRAGISAHVAARRENVAVELGHWS